MIAVKIALLVLLTVIPLTPVLLSLPVISVVVVIALAAPWLINPSWGPRIFVGSSLGLIQWRVWQLYLQRLKMSVYVSSPSMAIQNRSAVWPWLELRRLIATAANGVANVRSSAGAATSVTVFTWQLWSPLDTTQSCALFIDDYVPLASQPNLP